MDDELEKIKQTYNTTHTFFQQFRTNINILEDGVGL